MKALPADCTFSYVPECDRSLPVGDQTTFQLRRLTVGERAAIADMENDETLTQDDEGRPVLTRRRRPGMAALDRLRTGIKGWSNLRDVHGVPIIFAIGKVPKQVAGKVISCPDDEMLDLIPEQVLREIEIAIFDAARLTDDDRKKSPSPLPQPSTAI